MSNNADIEQEIREFVLSLDGAEIDEEILIEFLLKLPEKTGEVPIGVCYNGGEIGIIKVEYSGNPCQGVRKWCSLVKLNRSV